jgi:dihydrofolate reductase
VREAIASVFVSLDGFASDAPNEEMEWVTAGFGEEKAEFGIERVRSMHTLVLGRVTYEIMADYWPMAGEDEGEFAELMNSVPKVVFSKSLKQGDVVWRNTRVAGGDLVQEMTRLKRGDGGVIGISGSVELVKSLIAAGLLERLQLQIHPVVLGANGGKALFEGYDPTDLQLVDSRVLDSEIAVLEYRLEAEEPYPHSKRTEQGKESR